jgi:RND family efflux transporter MFP subunit
LTQARTALAYTRIRAPFAGVVTEKKVETGMLATPGSPMFTIEDTRRYRLEVTVDESELRTVRNGQVSPVMVDALGNVPLTGKVAQIIPAADATSRSFLVKVELPPDARLRSGLFGRAHFPRGERSALLIPYNSLVTRGQLQGVYVLDANQIAGLRYVTVGKNAGEQIEILSGLQEGEKLASAPGDRDLGGKRIAPRP